ncbi:MAG: DNA recombination/repair protein RecA, partial [Flammeovirgaceae bacterium]|nr:DNA recombination/repair protein RecA [Flammeovirgaceae bacterium]
MTSEPSAYDDIFSLIKSKLNDPRIIYTLHGEIEKFLSLPSDVAPIDECLSGGLPEGRVIEIFGPEASGKTTVTLHFIAAAQRRGEVVYFIDAEHSLDPSYAKRIGVDFEKLMFCQPDSGEQALETVRVICEATADIQEKRKEKIRTLIVVDSIPALIPKELFEIYERDGFESSNALGAQARMLSQKIPMV